MMALEEIDFSLWTEVKRQEARNELGVGTIDYSEMSDQELEDSLIELGNEMKIRDVAIIEPQESIDFLNSTIIIKIG